MPRRLTGALTLFIVLVFPIAAAAGSARAQEPPPVSGSIHEIDDREFPVVQAIVTLVDSAGRPIRGLQAADFVAQETGVEAQVTSVETVLDQQIGVAVVLVIDTSGSMEGAPISQARNAARSFVENLAETDEAAVVSFAEGVAVQSALTGDRAQTLAALDGLTAVGNTALYSGVVEAVNQARAAALPRKAIILLSDGQDFGGASQASREEALDLAAAARVPIYAIGLGLDIDRPFLEALASASGGSFIEAPAPAQIPEIYDQISELLRSQYVVTLESSAPEDQPERSIRLVASTPQGSVELTSDYTTSRTILPPTLPPPTPTITLPVFDVQPPEEDSGGGGLPLLFVLLLLGGASAAVGVVYYRRSMQRKELARQIEAMSRRAMEELNLENGAQERPLPSGPTRKVTLIGPDGEETFEIGQEPFTIGSGGECQIRLGNGTGVAEQHARCWLREGTLMLHHLAPAYQSLVGGNSVTWVSLDRGDEVQIGAYRLRVDS